MSLRDMSGKIRKGLQNLLISHERNHILKINAPYYFNGKSTVDRLFPTYSTSRDTVWVDLKEQNGRQKKPTKCLDFLYSTVVMPLSINDQRSTLLSLDAYDQI